MLLAAYVAVWLLSQPQPTHSYSFAFEIYRQSVFEPDSLDWWLLENIEQLEDERFMTCFNSLNDGGVFPRRKRPPRGFAPRDGAHIGRKTVSSDQAASQHVLRERYRG